MRDFQTIFERLGIFDHKHQIRLKIFSSTRVKKTKQKLILCEWKTYSRRCNTRFHVWLLQLSYCVPNNNLTSRIRTCFIQEPRAPSTQNKSRQQNHWLQNLTYSVTKPHYCILYNAHEEVRQLMLVFERESFQLKTFHLVHLFTIYNSEPNSTIRVNSRVIHRLLCPLVSQDWQHTILEHFMHNLSQRKPEMPKPGPLIWPCHIWRGEQKQAYLYF